MIYPFTSLTWFPLLRLFIRKTHNIGNLPKPPFILATNHESYLDPMLLDSVVIPRIDKQVHFLSMKGRFWHVFGDTLSRKWAGCVPLDEGKERAVKELVRLLKKGDAVGIFPGGPRTLDGNLTRGKTGAVRLALEAKVPIVPAGIIGAYEIAPKERLIPRLKRCEIRFGKPVYYDKYYDKKVAKKSLRKLTNELMQKIAKLINKKYLYND